MSKKELLKKMTQAVLDIDDVALMELVKEGLKEKIPPMEMIMEGMNPALTEIGKGFETGKRFMSDLVIAGDMMIEATELLRPTIEAAGGKGNEVMIIGTVEGDVHFVGKRIVSAVFTGAGYKVIDIGENKPAKAFVDAAKEHKAVIVGASAILSPCKSYCGVIAQALIDAGIRDKVIFIVGGWAFTQELADQFGADAVGVDAIKAMEQVKLIKAGEIKKLKDRKKK